LLMRLGFAIVVGFVLLRTSNLYGDPTPWATHDTWLATVLSFVDCQKYPPSLLYLMMTLGPAMIVLALLESARGLIADWLAAFGGVPLLYYVAHIFLLHALAIAFAFAVYGSDAWLLVRFPPSRPPGYGLDLAGIYAVWLLVVVALQPLCRRFAAFKQ